MYADLMVLLMYTVKLQVLGPGPEGGPEVYSSSRGSALLSHLNDVIRGACDLIESKADRQRCD